jgi:cathepsin B
MNSKLVLLALASIATVGVLIAGYSTVKSKPRMTKFQKMAAEINSDSTSTWIANENLPKRFLLQNLKAQFNLKIEKELPSNFDKAPIHNLKLSDLPESLDLREKYPDCEAIKEIRDQSACGSCWALGAVSAMSDRLCIASGKNDQRRISADELLSCCNECGDGCNGGYLYSAWSFWKKEGIVTGDLYGDKKSCQPYSFPPCNHHSEGPYDDCSKHNYNTPTCKNTCTNADYPKPFNKDKIYAAFIYSIKGEEQILQELNSYGSIEVGFTVYEDFLLYKSGVYEHKTGNELGGHAVKIIGYGVENDVKYWLIVNSWNENWGDKGTFKMIRGKDNCGIESEGVAGLHSLANLF